MDERAVKRRTGQSHADLISQHITLTQKQCGSKSVISVQKACILVTVRYIVYMISFIYRDCLGTAFVRNDAKVFRFCTSKYVVLLLAPMVLAYSDILSQMP